MKKLLALLLVLAMVFSMMTFLVACDSEDTDDDDDKSDKDDKDDDEDEDEEDEEEGEIYGQWKGTINFAGQLNELLEQKIGEEALEYLEVEDLDLIMYLEFTEDGEYTISYDNDAFKEELEELLPYWVDGFEKAAEDRGKDIDELEDELGMSIEKYLERNLLDSFPEFEGQEGEFELDGSKLYMDSDEIYSKIKVTAKTLKFTSYSGEDQDGFELVFKNTTFKRQ